MTFDKCSWLDRKHTIFGKVTGETIFNLMAMSNLDVVENEKPINPPVINSTRVLINPFEDIIVRALKPE